MNKQKPIGKGFMGFVNSIITNRVTLKQQDAKKESTLEEAVAVLQPASDLALIQQIQESRLDVKSGVQSLPRGSLGLGYQSTQAELEGVTQIQKLKNQIRKSQEFQQNQEQAKKSIQVVDAASKHGLVERKPKAERDERTEMINERKEKKRLKKERQKVKKEVVVVPIQEEPEINEEAEKVKEWAKRPAIDYKKLKMKTRSKQKNKKKDNRPIEVKRAKLAERGIII